MQYFDDALTFGDVDRLTEAAYKYRRQIEIVEEPPKTVTGKLLRRGLRARAEAKTTSG